MKLLNIYFGCPWQKFDFEKMSNTSYHGGDPCIRVLRFLLKHQLSFGVHSKIISAHPILLLYIDKPCHGRPAPPLIGQCQSRAPPHKLSLGLIQKTAIPPALPFGTSLLTYYGKVISLVRRHTFPHKSYNSTL